MGDRVGMPAGMLLDHFGRWLDEAFPDSAFGGPFVCGSSLETRDWHDIDVRLVLTDEAFDALFPDITEPHFRNVRWSLICSAISALGQQQTGLPIDFQIQKEATIQDDRKHGRNNSRCQYVGRIRSAPVAEQAEAMRLGVWISHRCPSPTTHLLRCLSNHFPEETHIMATTEVRHPEITVELVGGDGNAFAVLGTVQKAMRRAGLPAEEVAEFMAAATAGDYDHLLATCMAWVDVA